MKPLAAIFKPLSFATVAVTGLFLGWHLSVSAAVLPPGNISSCGELAAPGTYTLTSNIGSGGSCLTITSNSVVVDGAGFSVNGTVSANNTASSGQGYGFTLQYVTVSGAVSSVAGATDINNDCSQGPSGGVGGSISVSHATTSSILSQGGAGGMGCDAAGQGGSLTVSYSNTGTLSSHGGSGNYSAGGGSISVDHSVTGNISTRGTDGNESTGSGGAITLSYSQVGTVSASGGAGAGWSSTGSGGNIIINNSQVGASVLSNGSGDGSGLAAAGGSISISGDDISLSNTTISALGGINNDGIRASNGSLAITYTGTFARASTTLSALSSLTVHAPGPATYGPMAFAGGAFPILPGAVSSCGTLFGSGTYTLTGNIGSGGTCLVIATNGVVLDGAGFSINGGISGTGAGQTVDVLNNEVSAPQAGKSFSLSNVTVTGAIASNGGSGVSNVSASCGGKNGGNITISQATTSAVSSLGGSDGNCGYGPYSGSGGNITIDGGSAVTGNVSTDGGSASAVNAGPGGSIAISGASSVIGSLSANGGSAGDGSGMPGGQISIIGDSSVSGSISTNGGGGGWASAGSGGDIVISGTDVDISNKVISATGGACTGCSPAAPGTLTVTYSGTLTTTSTTLSALSDLILNGGHYGVFSAGAFPVLPGGIITSASQCSSILFSGTYLVQSFTGNCVITHDDIILDGGGTATITGNVTSADGASGGADENSGSGTAGSKSADINLQDITVTGPVTTGAGGAGGNGLWFFGGNGGSSGSITITSSVTGSVTTGAGGAGGNGVSINGGDAGSSGSITISGADLDLSGGTLSVGAAGAGGDDGCGGNCGGFGANGLDGSITITNTGTLTTTNTTLSATPSLTVTKNGNTQGPFYFSGGLFPLFPGDTVTSASQCASLYFPGTYGVASFTGDCTILHDGITLDGGGTETITGSVTSADGVGGITYVDNVYNNGTAGTKGIDINLQDITVTGSITTGAGGAGGDGYYDDNIGNYGVYGGAGGSSGSITISGADLDLSGKILSVGAGGAGGADSCLTHCGGYGSTGALGSITITNTGSSVLDVSKRSDLQLSAVSNLTIVDNGTTHDYGAFPGGALILPGDTIMSASQCSLLSIPGTYGVASFTGNCVIAHDGVTLDGGGTETITGSVTSANGADGGMNVGFYGTDGSKSADINLQDITVTGSVMTGAGGSGGSADLNGGNGASSGSISITSSITGSTVATGAGGSGGSVTSDLYGYFSGGSGGSSGSITISGTDLDLSGKTLSVGAAGALGVDWCGGGCGRNSANGSAGSITITNTGASVLDFSKRSDLQLSAVSNLTIIDNGATNDYGAFAGGILMFPGDTVTSASQCASLYFPGTYGVASFTGDCTILHDGITLDGGGTETITGSVTGANGSEDMGSGSTKGIDIHLTNISVTGNVTSGNAGINTGANGGNNNAGSNGGSITISNSSVAGVISAGNSGVVDGSGNGYNGGNGGNITIAGSTVATTTAGNAGWGVADGANGGTGGSVTITNSTTTGNIAAGLGGSSGGAAYGGDGGSVSISGTNLDLSGITISSGSGTDLGCGGGCGNPGASGSVTVLYSGLTTNTSTYVYTGTGNFTLNGIVYAFPSAPGWNGVFNPLIYYFYDGPTGIQPFASANGNWADAGNWYNAVDYSVQDENVPTGLNQVIINSSVTQNTGSIAEADSVVVNGDSTIDISINVRKTIIFNGGSTNNGYISTSGAFFNASSTNNGNFGIPQLPTTFNDGLISYWNLDEEGGDRADSIGNHTLSDNNSVGFVSGKNGNAALFNGGNWLDSNEHFDLSGGFTVSGWIKRTSPTNNSPAISQWRFGNGGFYLGAGDNFTTGDDIFFAVSGGTRTLTHPASNNWDYVTAAYNPSGETRLYVNGVLVDSANSSAFSDDVDATFKLGTLDGGGEFTYVGNTDDVNLWGRSLTDSEIKGIYKNKDSVSYANDLAFAGDLSNNNGTTTGSVTRLYTASASTTRNFTTEGNRSDWIVIAQGVVVDLASAVYDVATNLFKALAGGWFIPNPDINSGEHVVPLISVGTSTLAYTGASNTKTTKWNPHVDWDNAVGCIYSYNSDFSDAMETTCSGDDTSLPRPTAGEHTLYLRGTNSHGSFSETSLTFFYDNTAPLSIGAGDAALALDESTRPYYYLASDVSFPLVFSVNAELRGTATSTASSTGGYTISGDIDALGHNFVIKNVTVTGTTTSNGALSGANGGNISVYNSTIGYIVSNGANNGSGRGGNGGTVFVDPSVVIAVTANGGDGTTGGGSGGSVTLLSSDSDIITANGGHATSCGNGGDAGDITLTDSTYTTLTNDPGTGASSGCPGSSHSSGTRHSAPVIHVSPRPSTSPAQTTAVRTTTSGTNAVLREFRRATAESLSTVSLPVSLVGRLPALAPLPVFGGAGTSSFSFVSPISKFLFDPMPESVRASLGEAPGLKAYFESIGVTNSQSLVRLSLNPKVLSAKDIQTPGIYAVSKDGKAVPTSVSSDGRATLFQHVRVSPNDKLRVSVIPTANDAVTGSFDGKSISFDSSNSATVAVPKAPGSYILRSSASPLTLVIKVSGEETVSTPVAPESPPKPQTLWGRVKGFFGFGRAKIN